MTDKEKKQLQELKIGDTVWCIDSMDDAIAYTYMATMGDFIIVPAERVVNDIIISASRLAGDPFINYEVKFFHKSNVFTSKKEALDKEYALKMAYEN